VLAAISHWFGIPESVAGYVTTCEATPTLVANDRDRAVGILNLRMRNDSGAEVWLMAVLLQFHRQGIGRALLGHAERSLARSGVEYLQVKTLSSARLDRGYHKYRSFYLAYGFRPLEELPMLWGPESPALMMVKAVPRAN
jgi:ribosomal protein S18 acetylase RimI-like enzyme